MGVNVKHARRNNAVGEHRSDAFILRAIDQPQAGCYHHVAGRFSAVLVLCDVYVAQQGSPISITWHYCRRNAMRLCVSHVLECANVSRARAVDTRWRVQRSPSRDTTACETPNIEKVSADSTQVTIVVVVTPAHRSAQGNGGREFPANLWQHTSSHASGVHKQSNRNRQASTTGRTSKARSSPATPGLSSIAR